MRHRRLAALPLLLAAFLAGCEVELPAGSIPAPISIAPAPSASVGQPKYVCSAVYKTLTEGALRLATYAAGSGDDATAGMRQTLTDMAAQVEEERTRATDIGLLDAMQKISQELAAGAARPDPKAYINGDFQTVGQKLDGHCE
ncbi:hypothetical protein JIG36_38700 [Actinoplanes sp. LDG1-06]|uniref:Lipoprotein n=1 Tax=Paractinoplanes ovalisporus TaxID=2810368 RepID=A0ABS2ANP1_9ACTN|nr:hypothetical protein [Actinoplanes ovalisporus]MBM2621450.1 hypothetical protein [Actinoplanes ovalisporus]